MRTPGGLQRFLLLTGLRFRLVFRSLGRSAGRILLTIVLAMSFAAWALSLAFAARSLASRLPEDTDALIHLIFFIIFVTQVVLGIVSLAVSEFYDVSRILHLPVSYREVFAAMTAGGFFTPMMLIYAAPAIGCATVLPGGPLAFLGRLGALALLLLFGHALTLFLNLLFLTVLSRRKLRDLATVVASLLGAAFYLLMRSLAGDWVGLVQRNPTESVRWLPPAWAAELFLMEAPLGLQLARLAGFLVVVAALVWGGARALRAAFLGQLPSPSARALARADEKEREWLPSDLAGIVRVTRRLFSREPHVKALFLQQTVFLLAPLIFLNIDQPGGDREPEIAVMLLPIFLALSHLTFVQSLFGIDGRGIGQILLSPLPRWRLLLARGIALGGFFLLADLVLTVLLLGILGLSRGQLVLYLKLVPLAYVAVLIFDIVILTLGNVTSVYWPVRLTPQGRRALHGQRTENAGCAAQLVRMLVFFPAALLAAALAFAALFPVLGSDLLQIPVPRALVIVTTPAAVLVALVLYAVTVVAMGRKLQQREEAMLRALTDTGE